MQKKLHDVTIVRKDRVAGYRTLAAKLIRAHKELRPQSERKAYNMALIAIADFLKKNGWSDIVPIWFLELGSGLTDLDDGVVRPLFAARGTKALPSNVWRARAYVAGGVRLLIKKGKVSRDEAARLAVRAIPRGFGTKREVLDWYDQFNKTNSRIKNREAAHAYRVVCERQDKVDAAEVAQLHPDKIKEIAQRGYFPLVKTTLGE
jgi:hypothetical protein